MTVGGMLGGVRGGCDGALIEAGADVVKVFPCSALGGAKYLKALKALIIPA